MNDDTEPIGISTRKGIDPVLLAVPVAAVVVDRLLSRYPRAVFTLLTLSLVVTTVVASYKPAHALAIHVKHGPWDRKEFYQLPPLIDELEPGVRIVNAGTPSWNYPLLGKKLTNVVIDPGVWKLAFSPDGMSAESLRRHRIAYICVDGPRPEEWPSDLPVELIYDNSDASKSEHRSPIRVFRVVSRAVHGPDVQELR